MLAILGHIFHLISSRVVGFSANTVLFTAPHSRKFNGLIFKNFYDDLSKTLSEFHLRLQGHI